MLHQLNFEVSFAHTGKTLKGSHSFQTGLTAITGPNESGKSLRTEMIRYALFGVAALRSKSSTYEKINVTLSFQIGDNNYRVERSKNNATLYLDDNVNAKGTTPVNTAILNILGYDLVVFDVANACLQGEVEALSRMTPTERKGMVDKVIGLDAIDDLIKEVSNEMSGYRMMIDSLEKRIVPMYEKPEIPSAWHRRDLTSEQLEEEVKSLQLLATECHGLEQQLLALKCDEPIVPHTTELTEMWQLYEFKNNIKRDAFAISIRESSIQNLNLQKVKFKPEYSEETYKKYLDNNVPEAWDIYCKYSKQEDELEDKISELPQKAMIERLMLAFKLKDTFEEIDKLKSASSVTCPHCSNDFFLSQQQITRLEETIPEGFDKADIELLKNYSKYSNPSSFVFDIKAWEEYEEFKKLPIIEPPSDKFLGTREEIEAILKEFSNQKTVDSDIEKLMNEITEIKSNPDYHDEGYMPIIEERIKTRLKEEQDINEYKVKSSQWEKYQDFKEKNGSRIMEIIDSGAKLSKVQRELQACREYETLIHDYMIKSAANDTLKDELSETKIKLEELTKVRKALSELKPRVKVYLVPSLNRVASNLLSQMTNGQRNFINIDENFEIMVDGQPIDTLSGSAKAVANLAIRIGLGTVLTNKIFSVLIADEVDAAMDKERAAYTAQCLRNLTATFKQIILVSHQKPEADHQIEL